MCGFLVTPNSYICSDCSRASTNLPGAPRPLLWGDWLISTAFLQWKKTVETGQRGIHNASGLLEPTCCGGWTPRVKIHCGAVWQVSSAFFNEKGCRDKGSMMDLHSGSPPIMAGSPSEDPLVIWWVSVAFLWQGNPSTRPSHWLLSLGVCMLWWTGSRRDKPSRWGGGIKQCCLLLVPAGSTLLVWLVIGKEIWAVMGENTAGEATQLSSTSFLCLPPCLLRGWCGRVSWVPLQVLSPRRLSESSIWMHQPLVAQEEEELGQWNFSLYSFADANLP